MAEALRVLKRRTIADCALQELMPPEATSALPLAAEKTVYDQRLPWPSVPFGPETSEIR